MIRKKGRIYTAVDPTKTGGRPVLRIGQTVRLQTLSLDEARRLEEVVSKKEGIPQVGAVDGMEYFFGRTVTVRYIAGTSFKIEEDAPRNYSWNTVWIETADLFSDDEGLDDEDEVSEITLTG